MDVQNSTVDKALPEHIWKRVFSFIPKKNRKNVPLVNSFFYDIICGLEKFQHVLNIDGRNLEDGGILISKRRFRTVRFQIKMTEANMALMESVLAKHGTTVEKLIFCESYNPIVSYVNAVRLISFFKCVPRLKHLEWSMINFNFVKWVSHEPILRELETLTLGVTSNPSIEFAVMFTPNTMKSLTIIGSECWNQLGHLLRRQSSSLKELHLDNLHDVNIFNDLQLESLTLYSDETSNENLYYQLLSHHQELKEVSISSKSANMVTAICDMPNIETIDLLVFNENLNEINQFSRIQNLKKLTFVLSENSFEEEALIELSTLQLDKLEDLNLWRDSHVGINALFFETAGLNWPNLKILDVCTAAICKGSADTLNVFLDSFSRLECLSILFDNDGSFHEENEFNVDALNFYYRFQQYPYLKRLDISGADILQLQDMLTSLPNLESLKLLEKKKSIPYSPHILHLLAQLHNLMDLSLNFSVSSRDARLENQEVVLLKKLCRRLKDFEISFFTFGIFEASLLNQFQNCDHFVEIIHHAGRKITLKSVKY